MTRSSSAVTWRAAWGSALAWHIVRNFHTENSSLLKPCRRCRKKTGPRLSMRTINAINAMSGASRMIATVPIPRSRTRFTNARERHRWPGAAPRAGRRRSRRSQLRGGLGGFVEEQGDRVRHRREPIRDLADAGGGRLIDRHDDQVHVRHDSMPEHRIGGSEYRDAEQREGRAFRSVVEHSENVHVTSVDRRRDEVFGMAGRADHDHVRCEQPP